MKRTASGIAIAHRVFAHEDFDHTANILLQLLNNAQRQFAGAKRHLYLDIDGHRNSAGGFDDDMLELQSKFMAEFLIQFLTRADTPLGSFQNPNPQNDKIPEEMQLIRVDRPPSGGLDQSAIKPRF